LGNPYGVEHRAARGRLLAGAPTCWVDGCDEPATVADHQPPLVAHVHLGADRGCCILVPQCARHSAAQGAQLRRGIRTPAPWDALELVEDPAGLELGAPCWRVPWLADVLDVPDAAVWPRLMTPPHARAVDSLGADFIGFAEARSGRPLRWWQRLVSVRVLEVDDTGRLCWDSVLLTLARQLGKSWWLRELLWWRMEQAARFGEPQTVLHTGKDLSVCKEIQRPARIYAKQHPDEYKVREVNGQEEIERLDDGSRWMLRAKTAVYGMAASLAAVDEAWKVAAEVVDDGVTPTMVEREQPQLLLVSTAHRKATSLMLNRRRVALGGLDDPGSADLLIEWSAPRTAPIDDPGTWRLASPHWTPQREKVIADALERALRGEIDDVDEPEPLEAFRSQWLNQWPTSLVRHDKGELLVDVDDWSETATDRDGYGPAVVGVEDWFGKGAAVAVVRECDGGWIAAGWEFPRRSDAFARAVLVLDQVPDSRLIVGATLAEDPAIADMTARDTIPATGPRTRAGLALIRDLVAGGRLFHDPVDGDELDEQVTSARVSALSSGLTLVAGTRADLLRAVAWAVTVAVATEPVAAVR
jgi:hypothetical protein